MQLPVQGWIKTSLIDYPGHICSCVFLARCNFRCGYCHNPDLVCVAPDAAPAFSTAEIVAYLRHYHKLIEGICVTGGEPLLARGLLDFLGEIRGLGLKIKLDTNGSVPEMLEGLLAKGLVDYVAMDIKGPMEKLARITRAKLPVQSLKESLARSVRILMSSGADYEFRTTVVPGLLEVRDFVDIGKWIQGSKRFVLQQFRPGRTLDPSFSHLKPYPPEYLERIAGQMKNFVEDCSIRGIG